MGVTHIDSRGGSMKANKAVHASIDEYIGRFPPEIQEILEKIRATVKEAAPDAEETIKYDMPTFTLKGNLVYFAAFKNHIGFYPPVEGFEEELAAYEVGKGAIRFPLDKPIPYDLISRIVTQRVYENTIKAAAKAKKK
jgi:uncharacterized protein YdhG (YjbR/CyaY superfamily)